MTSENTTTGNVFDDLGFSQEESLNLKIRAIIMRAVVDYIKKNKLTQKEAATFLGVTQPRISDLKRGRLHLFSVDCLINMLARANITVSLLIDDRLAA